MDKKVFRQTDWLTMQDRVEKIPCILKEQNAELTEAKEPLTAPPTVWSAPCTALHHITFLSWKPQKLSLCYTSPILSGAVSILVKTVSNLYSCFLHKNCKPQPQVPSRFAGLGNTLDMLI